jgi:hypothetical protein
MATAAMAAPAGPRAGAGDGGWGRWPVAQAVGSGARGQIWTLSTGSASTAGSWCGGGCDGGRWRLRWRQLVGACAGDVGWRSLLCHLSPHVLTRRSLRGRHRRRLRHHGLLVGSARPCLELRSSDLAPRWWCVATTSGQQWPRQRLWGLCIRAAEVACFCSGASLGIVLGFSWVKALATATALGAASPVEGVVLPSTVLHGRKPRPFRTSDGGVLDVTPFLKASLPLDRGSKFWKSRW